LYLVGTFYDFRYAGAGATNAQQSILMTPAASFQETLKNHFEPGMISSYFVENKKGALVFLA
jgi:hypothetical protein